MGVIELDSLTKYYGEIRGIENLSFEVEEGEIFGYLGPNGAGKTTTIRTLLGFLKPTSGRARVLGRDIGKEIVEIKQEVGYIPGDLSLYGNLTGKEFLDYFASLRSSNSSMLDDLLDTFEVPFERKIEGFSRGMKQKLAIVQAFMHDPKLVIMDEPTAGLDPLMQQKLYEFLEQEKEKGKTLFFSSHILSEVDKICDRVGIIREGRLVALEGIESLKSKRGKVVRVKIEGDPEKFDGPEDTKIEDGGWIQFIVREDINYWIEKLSKFNVLDLEVQNFSLEDIFMHYYEEGETK
ncbi:ABC transporter [candidate division MSBL1 archaeon SCGC-AAA259M10]|uniref:ABC transporter n=4 Tax=candidate division MSBL1 TaxID=215777 RepID=A0A656YWY8_9EURY|nr:ABC transporter [candidate division MSBL1 archaeon SCGC-AAA259E22]KXA95434.1 ABC transporter [candidate division MSBL1 archaeon SCGC-AAA259I07]KXA98696.1 ABC transporter [candidate division MSBL1 archaeon SCGC-AAA259J03]KXB00893.1 ABC transporter [candidate division MSBL1 archaeon SCGC-AAA259M10]